MKPKIRLRIFLTSMLALALITACGGGGGGGDGTSTTGSTNTGTVALTLTDGPIEAYQHIFINVTRVSLLPAGGGPFFSIFESKDPKGYRIDLLDLREKENTFLLGVKKGVPAGEYVKIRLEVANIDAVGYEKGDLGYSGAAECANLPIKLPSEKIDLNPRGPFRVRKGETTAVKLDIDAEKSLLHRAGNSGKCIFSPTVFVEVERINRPDDRCPLILAGEIARLNTDEEENVNGFVLSLKEPWYSKQNEYPETRDKIDVNIADAETKLFDEDGNTIQANALKDIALPQMALVRGRLNSEGELNASLVVIDGVEVFKGAVTGSNMEDQFTIELFDGSGTLVVDYNEDTLILTDCNTEGTGIPIGSKVRVYGKFVQNGVAIENTFRAVVVVVKEQNLPWSLIRMQGVAGGYDLILEEIEEPIFLPDDAPVRLKGDGSILPSDLAGWVNCGKPRKVEIIFNQMELNQADELLVIQETLDTSVSTTTPAERIILYNTDQKILVGENATILRHLKQGEKTGIEFLDFREIKTDDHIVAYGLEACPDDVTGIGTVDFYANMIVILTDFYKDGEYYDDDSD